MIVSRSWVLVPVLALLTGAGVAAQEGGMAGEPAIEGTYSYVEEGSDDVKEAIDVAVRQVSWFIRTFARGRLEKTNPLYETVVIERAEGEWTILVDDRKPVTAPVDGTPVEWEREDGEVFDVTVELQEDGSLLQRFVAEDGERDNHYVLGPDGETMSMNVEIRSPKLKEPVRYTWMYERVEEGEGS